MLLLLLLLLQSLAVRRGLGGRELSHQDTADVIAANNSLQYPNPEPRYTLIHTAKPVGQTNSLLYLALAS